MLVAVKLLESLASEITGRDYRLQQNCRKAHPLLVLYPRGYNSSEAEYKRKHVCLSGLQNQRNDSTLKRISSLQW